MNNKLDHSPIREARGATPGEGIYLQLWRELMTARPTLLEDILSDLPFKTDQRAATVAATFMVWMGCNGGRDLTLMAERYATAAVIPTREAAFLAAWANYDMRRRGINGGLRASEFMLAANHPIDERETSRGRVRWEYVPEVAMRDRDVLEAMVAWWASAEAERLRAVAKPLIEAAVQREWSRLFEPEGAAS